MNLLANREKRLLLLTFIVYGSMIYWYRLFWGYSGGLRQMSAWLVYYWWYLHNKFSDHLFIAIDLFCNSYNSNNHLISLLWYWGVNDTKYVSGLAVLVVLIIRIFWCIVSTINKKITNTQIILKHKQIKTGGRRSSRSSTSLKGRMCKALSSPKETIWCMCWSYYKVRWRWLWGMVLWFITLCWSLCCTSGI